MKHIIFILVFMFIVISCHSLTVEEFQKANIGNIVHLKVEWNSKVYLEGDAVICFKIDESAQIHSTNPKDNFSGTFHCSFFTTIINPVSDDNLKVENQRLRDIIKLLVAELKKLIGIVELNNL